MRSGLVGEAEAGAAISYRILYEDTPMVKFLLWCILLVLCWPVALAALVLYPIVWLLLLPFRIVGIAVDGVLGALWMIVTLPLRAASRSRRRL